MAYIYKITNLKNNKIYVGYTKRDDINIRFKEHWRCRFQDNSILHRAMRKYGLKNFKIEPVEKISEDDWIEKEQYYINYFDCKVPKGYNICDGGNKPPAHFGDSNIKSKITQKQFGKLIQDLKSYDLDFGQIAQKYDLSQSEIERINKGEERYIEDENYPLREMKKDDYIISCIIRDLKEDILSQDEIEKKYQIKSRTRLYNINTGRVGKKKFPQEKYPIRIGIKNRQPTYLKNL